VSCGYRLEDLLVLLHDHAPTKVDAVTDHRRRIEHGLVSIGVKIHCLGDGRRFNALVDGLGGRHKILDVNYYKDARASLCLVLPPVGNARSAIFLLEAIEEFLGEPLFNNPQIQIQVCSPGRLSPRRSALLAIAFYLGSDTLRRYTLADLATSFTEHVQHPRGKRLVLYDADGDFDRDFDWWKRRGKDIVVEPHLPFASGRSDLLAGSASRMDIENINLIATLLVHAEYQGCWSRLGAKFESDMQSLLDRHLLAGLVDAPWVRTDDPKTSDDERFFSALQELVAYAFDEATRIRGKGPRRIFRNWQPPRGILQEVQVLLRTYRTELLGEARVAQRGERS
jgi:hypothetical protein